MRSTDNKPERIHSVRPVPRTITWWDGDQPKEERKEEKQYVVFFIHGGCLLVRRDKRGWSLDWKRRRIPVQSIAVRFHTPTCDQAPLRVTMRRTK